ncbi:MAG: hypothetical protein QXF46_06395 [Thermofilaceae archaeon]
MVIAIMIQVSRRMRRLLDVLKKRLSARSCDEVLQKLLAEKMGVPTTMFGSNPKLSSLWRGGRGRVCVTST